MGTKKEPTEPSPEVNSDNLSALIADMGGPAVWMVIAEQFKRREEAAVNKSASEARDQQQRYDKPLEEGLNRIGTAFIIGIVALVIWGVVVIVGGWVSAGDRADAVRLATCQRGDVAGCLKAVHDYGGTFTTDSDQASKVHMFRTAFNVTTGKELPLLDGEVPHAPKVYGGWTVDNNEEKGLTLSKDGARITIENTK